MPLSANILHLHYIYILPYRLQFCLPQESTPTWLLPCSWSLMIIVLLKQYISCFSHPYFQTHLLFFSLLNTQYNLANKCLLSAPTLKSLQCFNILIMPICISTKYSLITNGLHISFYADMQVVYLYLSILWDPESLSWYVSVTWYLKNHSTWLTACKISVGPHPIPHHIPNLLSALDSFNKLWKYEKEWLWILKKAFKGSQ